MPGAKRWFSPLRSYPFGAGWQSAGWSIAPSILVACVVVNWFEPGHFVGAGDVAPLVRTGLSSEAGSFWNHQMTGAGGTTADSGRLVEVLVIRLAAAAGADSLVAQRALFVGAMVLAYLGTAHAASLVLRRRGALVVAGLLGAFNPFVLLQLPNTIFPIAIGVAGLLFGELYGFRIGRRTSIVRLILASLPLAYLSINPPLVAIIAGATGLPLLLGALAHRSNRRQLATLGRGLPLAVMVHGFWIVPAIVVYSRGAEGLEFAAVTDPESWSWVYAQNSLGRVATLTAHWGWHTTEYFPWSERLDLWPWNWLRWVLPLGALAGCFAAGRGRRAIALLLGVATGALIVFSQGLHEPFSDLNAQLYDNVPGWWLFRDPVSKFGPLLVLAYATLFGFLIDRLLECSPSSRRVVVQRSGQLAALVVAAAAIAHPWPLLTGHVVASDRGTLPSSDVAVPPEWAELGSQVSESDSDGKVAVLPLNDYYQLTTTWGYHGVDIVNQFFDRPVIQRLPGGYFSEKPGFDALLDEMETAVLTGDAARADRIFDALGVSHLVVRHDIVGPTVDLEDLETGAQQLTGLEIVAQTDVATLFVRPGVAPVRAVPVATSAPAGSESAVVGRSDHLVVPVTARAQAFTWGAGDPASVAMVLAGQNASIRLAPETAVDVRFVVEEDRLVGYPADRIVVNGQNVSSAPVVDLALGQHELEVEALELGDRTVPFVPGMVESINEGEMIRILHRRDEPVGIGGKLSDCNRVDDRSMSELGFSAERGSDSITLTASAHSACVAYPLRLAGTNGVVSLEAKSIAGLPARACVWQRSEGRCLAHEVAESTTSELRLELPEDTEPGDLELFVYADGAGPAPAEALPTEPATTGVSTTGASTTRVTYERIRFSSLHGGAATTLDGTAVFPDVPTIAGVVSLRVLTERTGLLSPFSDVGDCHRVDERSLEEVGISLNRSGSRMELRASAHTACVNAPVAVDPGSSVLVSFTHSSPSGSIPRICLWQTGPDQCASAPAVGSAGDYRAVIETHPQATQLQLYFYVDGVAEGAVVAFDDIEVVRADAPTLLIDATSPTAGPPPGLETSKRSPSSFDVTVQDVEGDFWLVLPESFSEGWVVSGLPDGWTSEHFIADGYANAWRISGAGSAVLEIEHAPANRMRLANMASLLGLALTTMVGALRALRPIQHLSWDRIR